MKIVRALDFVIFSLGLFAVFMLGAVQHNWSVFSGVMSGLAIICVIENKNIIKKLKISGDSK